jgi:hypothetical protein
VDVQGRVVAEEGSVGAVAWLHRDVPPKSRPNGICALHVAQKECLCGRSHSFTMVFRTKARIASLRGQQTFQARPWPCVPAKAWRSDASKDAIMTMPQERVKRLEAENRELRAQLEVGYGRFLEEP